MQLGPSIFVGYCGELVWAIVTLLAGLVGATSLTSAGTSLLELELQT